MDHHGENGGTRLFTLEFLWKLREDDMRALAEERRAAEWAGAQRGQTRL